MQWIDIFIALSPPPFTNTGPRRLKRKCRRARLRPQHTRRGCEGRAATGSVKEEQTGQIQDLTYWPIGMRLRAHARRRPRHRPGTRQANSDMRLALSAVAGGQGTQRVDRLEVSARNKVHRRCASKSSFPLQRNSSTATLQLRRPLLPLYFEFVPTTPRPVLALRS